ncbi:MAG: hypothetical protein JNL38_02780, partial [Myxococcales bacterium]|nr:hypothetical protein [Myxococcales bacterium]
PLYEFEPKGLSFAKPAKVTFRTKGDTAVGEVAWSNADDSSLVERDSVQDGESLVAAVDHFSRGAAVLSTRCGLLTQRCCRASACRRAFLCRNTGVCASEDVGDASATDAKPDAPLPDGGTTLTPSCARMIRGTGKQSVAGLAADRAGGFYASGFVSGTADLGGGSFTTTSAVGNGFIARFDSTCAPVWVRVAGGVEGNSFGLLDVSNSGDVVLFGLDAAGVDLGSGPLPGGYGDILAKYDSAGMVKWAKKFFNEPAQHVLGVAAFGDLGDVFVGGSLVGSTNLGGAVLASPPGESHMLLARFDGSGNHQWSRTFTPGAQAPNPNNGGIPFAPGHGVLGVFPLGGDLVVLGSFNGYLDVGGGTLPAGEPSPPSWRSTLVMKRDASGGHLWSRSFRGDPTYAAKTPGGGLVYVANLSIATVDFGAAGKAGPGYVVVSLSPAGHPVWVRQLPGVQDISRVAVDTSGAVTVAGNYRGTHTFAGNTFTSHYVDAGDPTKSNDIFVVRYDALGNPLWSTSIGGPGVDFATVLAAQAGPGALLAATYEGPIELLGTTYTPQMRDAYVLKLNP